MTTRHGKYFARYTSDYGDEYELAAFSLGIGSLSEVVKAPEGYYIILRLEPEEDYLKANYEDFKDDIMGSEFNKIIAEYKAELTFELNDYGKTINYLEIE
jgi:parvulin-like peptidyl-prolyl isomerase